ncbi:MAG: hypothetical protein K2I17_02080 [Clostridia bacterium]|nr:hypothetical protein [Clostridia bacterium]
MKKAFTTIVACIIAILTLTLTACSDDKNGTYYPTNEEIQTNLENAGYTTCFTDSQTGWGGYAIKDEDENEYIYFCRPKTKDDCEYYYNLYEKNCKNYDVIVKIENDKKFGNIVYCGTENAISASGIKVVEVKVKV